jgi:dolichyl-phosphate mannosyltransferase polypeptide 3
MSFGAYLLGRLGLAILTFNDVPEAHAELQKQIEQAKTELRAQNIDVD